MGTLTLYNPYSTPGLNLSRKRGDNPHSNPYSNPSRKVTLQFEQNIIFFQVYTLTEALG